MTEPSGTEESINPSVHSTNGGLRDTQEPSFDADDSEAETERLHDSPTKKRLLEEDALASAKRLRVDPLEENTENLPPIHTNTQPPVIKPPEDTEKPPIAEPQSQSPMKTRPQSQPQPQPQPQREESDDDEEAAESSSNEAPAANEEEDEEEEDDDNDDNNEESEEDEETQQNSDQENNEERLKALKALTDIEIEFAHVRDALHDQQIAKFDLEIMMCSEGSHPELEQYNQQINEEYNTRLERTRSLLTYQMNAILTQSHASRCAVYQTFHKNKIEVRTELLNEVTRKWYQINYEMLRVGRHSPDFGYVASGKPHRVKRPTVQSLQITQHANLMNFPSAPRMSQVTEKECDADLRDIGLR